jgi:hypothetical protein
VGNEIRRGSSCSRARVGEVVIDKVSGQAERRCH